MASIGAPPPSYDAVVGSNSSVAGPSAPPLSDDYLNSLPRNGQFPPDRALSPDHSTDNTPAPLQPESHRTSLIKASADHCLEYYVSCSLCGYMHANVWMPRLFQTADPELDVEAHLGGRGNESARSKAERQRRLRCLSGSLCSCWVMLVFVFYFLPIAMIITGISSYDKCTNSVIVLYLIGGGALYALQAVFRTIGSSLTCWRNRGRFRMNRGSSRSAHCIGVMELVFLVLLLANLIVLALGTYYIMKDIGNGGTNECKGDIYRATVFFIVLQYVLYILAGLFSCLTYGCHRCLTSR
ncbi:hypothetical protein EMCRGX_G024806 [Ephydatia muelleri]|eukprot:Em0015g967a